jgi:3'-phosphoadenosine 5'-phosphosulfate sulfotransferase (PAPS reductase)/FAD synthetase
MITPNNLSKALELAARGALFVVNHSGGKDSQAMLIALLAVLPREQIIVMHADLGEVEHLGTQEHAMTQAADADVPFVVANATKTFFGMVEGRFAKRPSVPSWPSAKHRQCTSDLKRGPIQREVRRVAKERGIKLIVNCMGLRAQESPGRAKKPAWAVNKALSKSGRKAYDWLPIHGATTADVFATIKQAGQEPHWAYAAGNERLSCVFCIMGSANDAIVGATERPELFERYVALEERTGYTMHMSRKSLTELTGMSVGDAYLAHANRAPRRSLPVVQSGTPARGCGL